MGERLTNEIASPAVLSTTAGALLGLHAQTSLHVGAGTAIGAVDLPIQRERHTQWPTIAGSALKGILRDTCRETLRANGSRADADKHDQLVEVFGTPAGNASECAGALSVTDGRLLAFPVRSLKGVFAWGTCPAILDRLNRDIALTGASADLPAFTPREGQALIPAAGCPCVISGNKLVFEEFEFDATPSSEVDQIAVWIAGSLLPGGKSYRQTRERFERQLVIFDDTEFTHFARYATDIVARIGLDYETKTVRDGALFYQEFLPAESLLYAVVLANAARRRSGGSSAPEALEFVAKRLPPVLQIGGDATTGKGYCSTRLVTRGDLKSPSQGRIS